MKALIVIDVQNEFSAKGQRAVAGHAQYINNIRDRVKEARSKSIPIAWVKHYNLPNEPAAFIPGEWGSEFTEGMGPCAGSTREIIFEKHVYGAFTGSSIGAWLRSLGADTVVIMGFYSHMCVSTTSREALMEGLDVYIDQECTASCDIKHELLGSMSAQQVKRSALLQLSNMGAMILKGEL